MRGSSLKHFSDTFKHEEVHQSCFLTNRLEILQQQILACLTFRERKKNICCMVMNRRFDPEEFHFPIIHTRDLVVSQQSIHGWIAPLYEGCL